MEPTFTLLVDCCRRALGLLGEARLAERLRGAEFYQPGSRGFERDVARRMAWWAELKARTLKETECDKPSE